MELVNRKVQDLIPYEFNNKIHNEDQINRIANSIKEFWFTQPIVIDKDNIVIIGHGRLEWAKKLWLKEVPCVEMWNLTEAQVKKLRILDNKLNESERDISNLKLELDSIWDLNFWDLEFWTEDLFPELDFPDFNPEEMYDAQPKDNSLKLTVMVKDEAEMEMLKKDLDELWYKYQ